MTTLSSHRKRLHQVTPDLAYVMKYVDQGPHAGNHWFWEDGRRNHGHDARGQAYVRWRVRPTAASGYFTHGDFNVARLLIEQRQPIPPRSRVELFCGLSQCVNPDHWRVPVSRPQWRMQIRDDGFWQLVKSYSGAPAIHTVVVRLAHHGEVHQAAIAPLEQRSFAPPRAMCGYELPPTEVVVTTAPLSCAGCS